MFLFILGATIGALLMVTPDLVRTIATAHRRRFERRFNAELARRQRDLIDTDPFLNGWSEVPVKRFQPIRHP